MDSFGCYTNFAFLGLISVMVYGSYMFLGLFFKYFVENVCIYICKGYQFVAMFSCGASLVAQTVICPQCGRPMFDTWVRKIPWRRESLVFLQ